MIIVTIDLAPGGFAQRRRTIASMRIANVTRLADVSDYEVNVLEAANPLANTPPRNAGYCVKSHDRRQSVWALIARAANAAMEAEYDEL
jgi:hypothetical protein